MPTRRARVVVEHVRIAAARVEHLAGMLLEADGRHRPVVLALLDVVQVLLHGRVHRRRQDAAVAQRPRADLGASVEEQHRRAGLVQHGRPDPPRNIRATPSPSARRRCRSAGRRRHSSRGARRPSSATMEQAAAPSALPASLGKGGTHICSNNPASRMAWFHLMFSAQPPAKHNRGALPGRRSTSRRKDSTSSRWMKAW